MRARARCSRGPFEHCSYQPKGIGYSRTVFPDQGIVVDMVVKQYTVENKVQYDDFHAGIPRVLAKRVVTSQETTGECHGTVVAVYQIGEEPQVDDLKRHYEQIQGERLALTGTVQVDGEIIDG